VFTLRILALAAPARLEASPLRRATPAPPPGPLAPPLPRG
jgi:hypothetical protein